VALALKVIQNQRSAVAENTSGSGPAVYTREPGRWRRRWDSLALSTRVLVTVGEIRGPLSQLP
jgi:hypothetical protein